MRTFTDVSPEEGRVSGKPRGPPSPSPGPSCSLGQVDTGAASLRVSGQSFSYHSLACKVVSNSLKRMTADAGAGRMEKYLVCRKRPSVGYESVWYTPSLLKRTHGVLSEDLSLLLAVRIHTWGGNSVFALK